MISNITYKGVIKKLIIMWLLSGGNESRDSLSSTIDDSVQLYERLENRTSVSSNEDNKEKLLFSFSEVDRGYRSCVEISELTENLWKDYTVCGIRRSTLCLVIYIPIYIIYLVAGAALFAFIEGPIEMEHISKLKNTRADFLAAHPCVSGIF